MPFPVDAHLEPNLYFQPFSIYRGLRGRHEFDLSGSRDFIGQVTIRLAISHFVLLILWNQASTLTVSQVFNGECDAMIEMTLNDL